MSIQFNPQSISYLQYPLTLLIAKRTLLNISDVWSLCCVCHFIDACVRSQFQHIIFSRFISYISCYSALVIQRSYLWLSGFLVSLGDLVHVVFSPLIVTFKFIALSLISLLRVWLIIPDRLLIWLEPASTLQRRWIYFRVWWGWHNNCLTIQKLLIWNTV